MNLLVIDSYSRSKTYFQQEVNFIIDVKLNDISHIISGYESIEYINNSNDTLQFLYFHLWPNAYSSNRTELAKQLFSFNGKHKLFSNDALRGYIDSIDFKINGLRAKWRLLQDTSDVCKIYLNVPLLPSDTINISTPFRVRIPEGVSSRLGHIGESYQISQWYPKPAVYDINGWHYMPYLDQGEFFSEFGHYEVSISLPSNYTVGATGKLQTEAEINRLHKLASETRSEDYYIDNKFPPSSPEIKTIKYTERNIHDFAWFADKRFKVVTGNAVLKESGRKIQTMTLFTGNQADLWQHAIDYVNISIEYFSDLIGEYPYCNFTAVQSTLNAGLGMEYPGLTVIGQVDDDYSLDEVIAHEVCHSWFYGALGTNERLYPFMDEGITSEYTNRYMNSKYPDKKLWEIYFRNKRLAKFFGIEEMPASLANELELMIHARKNLEQPINLNAPDFTYINYDLMLYNKAARGFNYLRSYLGDSIFDNSIRQYYKNWKFRHPDPADLENELENSSGRNLDWFFHDFVGTTKKLDYKIVRYSENKVLLKNTGDLNSPVIITAFKDDSLVVQKWIDGFSGSKSICLPESSMYSNIVIDPYHVMPEYSRLNNNTDTRGLMKKSDPLNKRLYFTIEDPEKRSLIYIPLINWNREDGLMLGVAVNNGYLIPKTIEYSVVPFYSFKKPEIDGYGKLTFNIVPANSFIRKASFFLEGTKFGAPGGQNYKKARFQTELHLRNTDNQNYDHQIIGSYNLASDLQLLLAGEGTKLASYIIGGYKFTKTGKIDPYSISTLLEYNRDYSKASFELNYKYYYSKGISSMDLRLYSGLMLRNNNPNSIYSLAPSGRIGRELYLYQGTYPDRFSLPGQGFWSRQMTTSEGGLVTYLNDKLNFSRWLVSLNLASNLPGPLVRVPVKPFVNILFNEGYNSPNYPEIFFEGGIKTGIWNVFEINIPFLLSENIESVNDSLKERIRFILNLESLLNFKLN